MQEEADHMTIVNKSSGKPVYLVDATNAVARPDTCEHPKTGQDGMCRFCGEDTRKDQK